MKLTVQVKYPEQAKALRDTLVLANRACDWPSDRAWTEKEFRQFPLHRLCYHAMRAKFDLSAQLVIRLIPKVADSYKLDRKTKRKFRALGSISYDDRILAWNLERQGVNIWTVAGRMTIPFVAGQRQLELLRFRRGESDLVTRDGSYFLFATVDVPA